MRPRGRAATGAVAVLAVLTLAVVTLAGCSDPPAVGTRELADRLEAIEGVTSADVEYRDDFESGSHHTATVHARPEADLACIVDRALAELHHAVEGTLIVTVTDGERTADPTALGFLTDAVFPVELDKRYGTGAGEHPGNGTETRPTPTCDPVPSKG